MPVTILRPKILVYTLERKLKGSRGSNHQWKEPNTVPPPLEYGAHFHSVNSEWILAGDLGSYLKTARSVQLEHIRCAALEK